MESVFDLEKLSGILRDFYEISHIRLAIFDEEFNEIAAYPKEVDPFCQIVRRKKEGLSSCADCDKKACLKARETKKTQTYRCHMGLTEVVSPLIIEEKVVGYIFLAHMFDFPSYEQAWKEIEERNLELSLDTERLKKSLYGHNLIDDGYVSSATHVFSAVAHYLVKEEISLAKKDSSSVRLDEYLSTHFKEKVTASSVCKELGVGKTRLYELSNELYGYGINERLRRLRVDYAKTLLVSHPEMSLEEISSACGYSNYNYFIASFSKMEGMPPSSWKKAKRTAKP